ncbi:MAG: hypothetical protein M0Z46_02080 [Actinomycetota bacterium]|nr:hypothetical protein [Actinomycetota bacterium]
MRAVTPTRRLRRHPIQGLLGGLFMGLGAVILLSLSGAVAFGTWSPFAAIAGAFGLAGLLVGLFAPRAPG